MHLSWTRRLGVRMASFVSTSDGWLPVDEDYSYHQEVARAAFADMLHDHERNSCYRRALATAVQRLRSAGRPVRVLDIGTGTGLLSIMAAQIGADSIVACEAFKPMAECALKIIENNGFKDKIQLVPKRSTDMTVGENGDMKFKANILITEVFDTELIGEGAIETFRHAHAVLLEEDCIVVPDSATVYAQIVECPTLQRWNKLKDIVDDENRVILKTPVEIVRCPGSAAVHDIQLSQLSRSLFREITKPIPIFQFDWSGKKPVINSETFKFSRKSLISGSVEMLFMWWDLKMDLEGEIILSCAPWWNHRDTDFNRANPEESIPWRDHWMQAIYYFPEPLKVQRDDVVSLYASHDEFSLWFNVQVNENITNCEAKRPVCNCGVHMAYSRTHVAYMNDHEKSVKFANALRKYVDEETVCLCLNGASFVGLVAAKMGAKKVIYVEPGIIGKKILENYIKLNNLSSVVSIVSDTNSVAQNEISLIISDPHFSSAILPWDNLKFGFSKSKLQPILNAKTKIVPGSCSLWVISVEFLDLHKIKSALNVCEDVDMTIFDQLIKDSRDISDDEIEAQPLWEYPCICRSAPIKIADIHFDTVVDTISRLTDSVRCENDGFINGFVLWLEWDLDGDPSNKIGTGPTATPEINKKVSWDPCIRQAVKILEEGIMQNKEDTLRYNFSYNSNNGEINVNVSLDKNTLDNKLK